MTLFLVQFLIVLVCIGLGGRFGGIGLGAAGGLGLAILTFGFGLPPDSPPITVISIIIAVITCVTILQAAGGLDLLVTMAEKILRKWPGAITFLGPFVAFLFTALCGTGYVAFSVYPVIAEIATDARVRPERAMSMSVIAANFGLIASPVSAVITGTLAILAGLHVSALDILSVTVPGTLLGCLAGCLFVWKRGNELDNEPEFQRRIAEGTFKPLKTQENKDETASGKARKGLVIFIIGILLVVLMGSVPELRPLWNDGHTIKRMDVPTTLQIIMLTTACIIMLICRIPPLSLDSGSVFKSGLVGVVAIFGLSWMMNSFFAAWSDLFNSAYRDFQNPLLFGLLVFILSAVIYSPAATAVALFPAGVMMGYPAATLIALLPLTCGSFIIPGGAQIGCVAFDRTGTTKIGKYVVNHSYILPGLVTTLSSSVFCFLLAGILL
ncbi:TPA: anaerobic C4-dicarboxylate transporter family protein [Escherichia coli]|uniref:anaerobic C4-dicarboxylate transporter family protein n=1 Tax=Escherichia coli TaxID=562 RepID=UPI000BE3BD76|nr:anaerobic C4-dicarboxylate transporter family protein [Escherichia coli]EGA0673581.1 anaerobic C4-dicarboxylate transporter [Escherichia coli]EII8513985.1 anaerobic C4-dicarboxylate transporter [Escherichia coli]MBB7570240.1 anaerobic C4-dicarboxylate transporter [Escherichia coli]MBB9859939.1 anaerobic C4-dicarboxylate transporter [Escherichia coli]HAI4005371.1 anaerobic C4-dicarboxylate transporter [Escherichia coli]